MTQMSQPTHTYLPWPTTERWKPLRAGLIDVFYYDIEEFHFHDGRLLLRGNNGTGKSKVLALILPFLLDGDLSPHRVEPDGDRQKRMEWNLLLGGKHPYPERIGYAWLEFGRLNADGTAEYRTIGCGLKAVKDRGIAKHWYFITAQRIGPDLSLLGTSRVALTRERLRDAVEGQGMVYDRAADYRRAVDEALFGLGEQRYDALVNLLIQLRQPQLSKKPDEKLLSRALTEALPPISSTLITTVAEAFRGLDEERHALRALEEAERAAADFLRHYQRYAGVAAKRMARAPRETHSRYERLNRDLVEAEGQYAKADADLTAAEELLRELAELETQLEARRDALRQSPEMRDAERLDQLKADADRRESYALDREWERDQLAEDIRAGQARAEAEQERERLADNAFESAQQEAGSAAERSLCMREHREIAARWESDLAGVRRETRALAERRATAIAELGRLLDAVRAVLGRLEEARREVDRLTAELQAAAERIAAAEQLTLDESVELVAHYRRYLAEATELRVTDPDDVLTRLESWAESVDGPNPAVEAVADAAQRATTEFGRVEAGLRAEQETQRGRARELEQEIERLEAGGHDAPSAPYTRDPRARADRPGAPLWKVVDFAEDVPAEHRAGLEAALEASGILDAWLTPDGALLGVDDTVLLAATAPAATGDSCATLLHPAIDPADPQASALTNAAIHTVLAAIGLGPGTTTWASVDGRWANGVLNGSWHKPAADFIGEGAREQARRTRLEQLYVELADVGARLDELAAGLTDIVDRRARLDAERRAAPSDDGLRDAHRKLAGAHERRGELQAGHLAATQVVAEREADLEAARERAAEFAIDVGLPSEPDELDSARTGLDEYRLALAALWPAAEALLTARRLAKLAVEELARTTERLEAARAKAAKAREEANTARETHRVLEETVGTAVAELHRQLAAVQEELRRRQRNENEARRLENTARENRGRAAGTREQLNAEIGEAVAERDAAVAEFQQFVGTGLLRVALPALELPDPSEPWAATPAVLLARSVNAELEHVDDADGPWDRVQKRVAEEHKLLSDAMARHGHSVGLTLQANVIVVDVVFQSKPRAVPELAEALRAEIGERAQLLSAREREILENHLLNEVASTLQELIAAAEDEVERMNGELESRPTSTGMRLRLIWRPAKDAPGGLAGVREKLRQTVDAWSVADRAAVGDFLQEQIAREHAENPAAGWTEQLTRALDYRTWHEFAIQRYQEGQWRPATGPASGGERALVASVPLFAAASAHYKSAGNPCSPRLVALDEAFAGVDDDSRAKCLGLLATFDMDVVMTSEREWGCYPEMPGLAISHLARRDGIDAVLVTPWRWDGRTRQRVDRPVPALSAEPSATVPDQTGLFG